MNLLNILTIKTFNFYVHSLLWKQPEAPLKDINKPKDLNVINLEKGKIPPQAIDLEEVVLGAMMIDKKGVDEVIDILSIECFL